MARFSLAGALLFGGLVGSAVLNGGEKVGGTNGTDQVSMPTNGIGQTSMPTNGICSLGAPAPLLLGDPDPPLPPELRFTSIEPGASGVTLGLEWTPNLQLPEGKIGIYGKLDLRDPVWSWLGVWMPPLGATSGSVFVGDEFLTGDTSTHPPMAFFKASTVADSDGDGLRDRDETGWVEHGAALPTFDFTAADSLVDGATGNAASDVFTMPLPFTLHLAGRAVNEVAICKDGVVGFLAEGCSEPYVDRSSNYDFGLGYIYDGNHFTVAALWGNLILPSGISSHIRTLSTTIDGERWFAVEYAGVQSSIANLWEIPSLGTCQVAVCESDPQTVHVRYVTVVGGLAGMYVTVGAQGPGGVPNFPVGCDEDGLLSNGMVVSYHFGFGGDPQLKDTDDDGLDDAGEAAAGTSPTDPDTDGDGLPDGWEVENGLSPLSASGDDGPCGDFDHDGLLNMEERIFGTRANTGDSDGDGIDDAGEIGAIGPAEGPPWLEFSSYEDLTPRFPYDEFSTVDWLLPVELTMRGNLVTNVVVDINGVVYFCRADVASRPFSESPDGGEPFFRGALAVNPYWCEFAIGSDVDFPTRIRAGTAVHGGQSYLLVECANLIHEDYLTEDVEAMSFQIAVPVACPDRAFVRYRDLVGNGMDGRSGMVGFRCPDGTGHVFCGFEEGRICDGLSLQMLFGAGTDPKIADTDDDGLADAEERILGTNPCRVDSDGDGIADDWELGHGLDPLDPADAALDPDGDGLDNLGEYLNDTNPSGADDDHDGVPDGYDTDGDGVDDGTEAENGSDPNDPLDLGIPPTLDECRPIDFGIAGDYAAWEMVIEGQGPYDWRTMRLSMAAPGWTGTSGMKLLHKGNTYRLTMRWLNSDGHEDECAPWYCWEAQIDGKPSVKTFDDYSNTRKPGVAEVVIGDGWIAENASGLLTSHVHECTRKSDGSFGGGNVVRGKEVLLHVIDVVVDEIRFNRDRTTCTTDGVNLLWKFDENMEIGVSQGEWANGGVVNDPVCYVAGITPVVDVKFKVFPDTITGLRIGAVAMSSQGALGDMAPQMVTVDSGISGSYSYVSSHSVPHYVNKYEHMWEWRVSKLSVGSVQADVDFVGTETGNHSVYTILDEPDMPWDANASNMPTTPRVDALDFAVEIARGAANEFDVLYLTTDYLFAHMGFSYETQKGEAQYWNKKTRMFDLTGYMVSKCSKVNCYDQARAVVAVGNLLGCRARPVFIHPFGFINVTGLIGVGLCNNPFYEGDTFAKRLVVDSGTLAVQNFEVPRTPVCAVDSIARSTFGNHMFVISGDGNVFDACAGPSLGTQTISDYLRDTIDCSTMLEQIHGYFSPFDLHQTQTTVNLFLVK